MWRFFKDNSSVVQACILYFVIKSVLRSSGNIIETILFDFFLYLLRLEESVCVISLIMLFVSDSICNLN